MSLKMLGERDPEVLQSLYRYRRTIMKDGALSVKQKELIALALSSATKCDKCLTHHAEQAKAAGATNQEILETLEVVMYMVGPSAMIWSEEIDNVVTDSQE